MKKVCLFFLLLTGWCSCKFYAMKKYQLNKQFDFITKSSYLQFMMKRNIGAQQNFLYLDSTSYGNFLMDKIQEDSAVLYLGCYLNDSTSFLKSSFFTQNTSCSGRIEKEVLSNLAYKENDPLHFKKVRKLSAYKMHRLIKNDIFNINHDEKRIKLFLLYSHSYGTYYDSLIKNLKELVKQNEADISMYIICIDPLYSLK